MSVGFKIIPIDKFRLASLTATSEESGFDIDFAKLDDKFQIWRSTSLSTQTITATWVEPQNISAVAFAFANLVVGSTVQIKFYTNAGDGSPVAQTAAINIDFAPNIPIGENTIGLSSFPVGGGNYFFSSFDEQTVEKIEILVTSVGNPDGYMEIARIIAGSIIDITNGADFGAVVSYGDDVVSDRLGSGSLTASNGIRFKNVEFELGDLTPTDKSEINNMKRVVGKNVPIFVSAQDLSPVLAERDNFLVYGYINKDVTITTISYNTHITSLQVTEF